MAHWRRLNGHVTVIIRDKGKARKVPRADVRHLDGQPDWNVEQWLQVYELTRGRKTPTKAGECADPTLLAWVERYTQYLKSRDKSPTTVRQHRRMLLSHVLPYLIDGPPVFRNPLTWPDRSVKMTEALTTKGRTYGQCRLANIALRTFWEFLKDEGIVGTSVKLRLRNPLRVKQETPLAYTLTPDQVFEYVANVECSMKAPYPNSKKESLEEAAKLQKSRDDQLKLMALCGYFFSLRPQETFALVRNKLGTGDAIKSLACIKTMASLGLYAKLAVNIDLQKTDHGTLTKPKAGSGGWVSCFSERAAREIVAIVKEYKKDQKIFTTGNRALFRLWERDGIPEISLKSLRRASLYYIGHNTAIQPLELMKHARHASYSTTLLYLRRPEEIIESETDLDLDA